MRFCCELHEILTIPCIKNWAQNNMCLYFVITYQVGAECLVG
jgi:hypothetical protein